MGIVSQQRLLTSRVKMQLLEKKNIYIAIYLSVRLLYRGVFRKSATATYAKGFAEDETRSIEI